VQIELEPQFEMLVERKVQSGRYSSSADVLQEALRVMEERDELIAFCGGDVKHKIADGLASLREGRGVDSEEFFDKLLAEMDQAGNSKRP
jgi:antitoxin ParD1/3/4